MRNVLTHRGAALAALAAAALLWAWLLAGQPVYTAAMGMATPLVTWLRAVWSNSEDMGHGPFLPLVSLYVVWLRRRELAAAVSRPDARGFALSLLGLLLFWFGLKMEDVRVCLLALVLWTWAVPFALLGAGVARQLVFPCAYLLLCIPIDNLVIFFTMKLRLLSALAAVAVANGIGIATTRIGTGLHSAAGGGFNLDVAEACSGLRSIFAMTALAAAFAFFTQKDRLRQWTLFLCAVPVAVAGNIVRIVAIVIVAAFFGEKAATGFYHDYSGYVVFLVAILLLMELGRRIARIRLFDRWAAGRPAPPPAPPPAKGPASVRSAARLAWLAATPALLLAGGLAVRFEPPVKPGSLAFLPSALPVAVGPWSGTPLLSCGNEQCLRTFPETELKAQGAAPLPPPPAAPPVDPAEPWIPLRDLQPLYDCPVCQTGRLYAASLGERRQLPGDTKILRSRYTDGIHSVMVSMAISGSGRNSIHRPELCLPAQGFVMKRIRRLEVAGAAGAPLLLNRVELERTQGAEVMRMDVVYWFFTGERQTSSHVARVLWTAWDRAFRRQATRWVMVTVTASPGTAPRLPAFSSALMEGLRNKTL